MTTYTRSALFVFALSLTVFWIQPNDALMYLVLARDFVFGSFTGDHDPYLYSLPNATLTWTHEWLSYALFYGAWQLGEAAGMTLLKCAVLGATFWITLTRGPGRRDGLWAPLFVIGITAASFRFIERSSIFSDLILAWLVGRLLDADRMTPRLGATLCAVFLLWAQLHPAFPLGFLIVGGWAVVRRVRSPWLLGLALAPFVNPAGWRGYVYPFTFAFKEAAALEIANFEWMPSYHPVFRFAPETLAFWAFAGVALVLTARARAWRDPRTWLVLFALALGTRAVRFVPFAVYATLIALAGWTALAHVRIHRAVPRIASALLLVLAVKNVALGYPSSSGPRRPGFGFDPAFFPTENLELLRQHPIPGRLYNAHEFGAALLWANMGPVFHHGFVTDPDFYRDEVVGAISRPEVFFRLAEKYGWTMLLVDKRNTYRSFYAFLKDRPEWRIVGEDGASYLIYHL